MKWRIPGLQPKRKRKHHHAAKKRATARKSKRTGRFVKG